MIVVVVSQLRCRAQIFSLRCDTIDDSGVSTQRHDDGTTVLNDLRLEMALAMWIVSVHEKSEQL